MLNNNIKSQIIPDEMKEKIDEILEQQLFNANRYYAESNSNIFELMRLEIFKPSTIFLDDLKSRWNWHNHFYEELLEPAYIELTDNNVNELTPLRMEELIKVYKTCCLVDEATLVTSGAIKKHLQEQLQNISIESEAVSKQDAIFMLLTPPIESFFVQYHIDHLSYLVLLKTGDERINKYKEYLLRHYHAYDEKIFESRFKKKFAFKINNSVEELLNEIQSCKISDEYKIKHFYFTLEHKDRKAYRDIITYDNVDEKYIACQLIGISGFLFRKQILNYLNETNILPNNGYIYEYSNIEIVDGLNKLLDERRMLMQKAVNPYRQSADTTCAIACMLMVLDYYKMIPKVDRRYEKKYYNVYHSFYLDGTPFSALAWHFAKNDLETEIFHSELNIFSNSNNALPQDIFDKSMQEYKRFLQGAENKGAKVINGADINCETLKERLEEDKLVILAGQMGEYLHAILLCGYEDNNFIVCDPLVKQKQLKTYEEITAFMNTSIGKWYIAVKQKKKNKEILIDNLDKYQNDAKEKLFIKDKEETKFSEIVSINQKVIKKGD